MLTAAVWLYAFGLPFLIVSATGTDMREWHRDKFGYGVACLFTAAICLTIWINR